jgi:DUF4097 and DUF4098 domain-containing protein YvlB
MNKSKTLIIVAAVLTVVGLITCGISFAALDFDPARLSSGNFQTNEYSLTEDFQNINITIDSAKVEILPSETGECLIECRESKDEPYNVEVNGAALVITQQRNRSFNIGLITEKPKITLHLPKDTYSSLMLGTDSGDVVISDGFTFSSVDVNVDLGSVYCSADVSGMLSIETDAGEISVNDLSASAIKLTTDIGDIAVASTACSGNLEITSDTGKVTLKDVTCENFTSSGDTGSLIMTNAVASGRFDLKRQTGDIWFNGCDAAEIYAKTDTGSVTGMFFSDKVFLASSDTGSISVPKTITGGRCEIITDTGDIDLVIESKGDKI